MKTIFISGKYYDKDYYILQDNIRYAENVGVQLLFKKWNVIIPHKNFEFAHIYFDSLNSDFWLERCLTLLSKCDSILMLRNWKKSDGAKKEYKFAKENNIPIFYEKDGIPETSQLMILNKMER